REALTGSFDRIGVGSLKPPLSVTALWRHVPFEAAVESAAPQRWQPLMHRAREGSLRVRMEDSGTDTRLRSRRNKVRPPWRPCNLGPSHGRRPKGSASYPVGRLLGRRQTRRFSSTAVGL